MRNIEAKDIATRLADHPLAVAEYLLPSGKLDGNEWRAGDVSGAPGKSLGIHLAGDKAGVWQDFATGKGGDLLDLWQAVRGCDFKQALDESADYLGMDTTQDRPKPKPLPVRTSPPDGVDGVSRFTYTDTDKRPVIYVTRKDTTDGKSIRQWGRGPDGKGWMSNLKHAPRPRPLYRLPAILKAGGTVCIHEGEKAVVAASKAHLRGIHTTSISGAGNARHSNFTPLKGRDVCIIPDNDEPGEKHAQQVARLATDAGAKSVKIVCLPGLPAKGDVVEWLQADGTDEQWCRLLDATKAEIELQLKAVGVSPEGYSCTRSGVSIEDEDKGQEKLTHKPVWVSALSRDGSRENWGRLVHWQDADSGEHERPIPAQLFHANGNELAQELASSGLPIIPGKERKLLQYLAAFNPEKRLTAAPATGWHGEAFVLPDRTINEPENERIIYQAVEYQNGGCIASRGTLSDWQTLMGDVSLIVKFVIACSFAAPVRFKAGTAAGGFHFYGQTSQGKTTMLQAGASVWGNASDPALAGGADAYIQRWNATRNGLEGMASSFNDLPLIIDEIGEGEERDFGRIIYQLMSGTGKQRANRTGGMRQRRTWRILLLSNGELPVSDFIPNARGGQLVRLIDIPAKAMFSDRESADEMKQGCAEVYGLAGPAFIESGNLLEGWDEMTAESIGDAPTPESGRVRDRFRLVAHAGELAIRRGILPWNQGDVLEACKSVFASWKENGVAVSDADRGIANVREFIMAYGVSRFERDDFKREPIDRAGWFRNDIYHFTDAAFKEACKGVLPDTVRRALKGKKLLHLSDSKRLKAQIKVEGKPVRVVSVKADILSSCENAAGTVGTVGTVGTGQGAQGFDAYPLEKTERVRAGTEPDTASTNKTGAGTAESYTGQGLYPPYPPLPPENAKSEKVTTDEPDFGGGLPPVRRVAGGLLI